MKKIFIDYKFKNRPWGGGNQFLKALKKQLIKRKLFTTDISKAKILIVNSHHFSLNFFFSYLKNKHINVIHRIDGPIHLTRDKNYGYIDSLIHLFSKYFADGVIFQSNWSKKQNIKFGFDKKIKNTVIYNAPDNKIFFKKKTNNFNNQKKINIVASSWSSNLKKGFNYLYFLDKNLNFNNFKITFIGNSPLKFKKIKMLPPLKSRKLSKILRQNEYFLTASLNDPCSNSLLEAINCGLIPVYLDSGGHKEIANNRGIKFRNKKELLIKLNQIRKIKSFNKEKISIDNIETVAENYLNFFKNSTSNKPNLLIRIKNIIFYLSRFLYFKLIKKF